MTQPPEEHQQQQQERKELRRQVVLVDGITVLFGLTVAAACLAADALLLVFACVLFAVLLFKLAELVRRYAPIRHTWAVTLVLLALLAVLGLGGWLMAPQISEQSTQLAKDIPASIERVRAQLDRYAWFQLIEHQLPSPAQLTRQLANLVPNAGLFFAGVFGAAGNVVVIVVVGTYLALAPDTYVNGIVRLVPKAKRQRTREVLSALGKNLGNWLLGKFASMLIVGIVTSLGLGMLGVPLGLILGIIAGLLDFIPYLGPIMAGVPAVLIAVTISPDLALYTILLFLGIQLVEGYVLQPLIEAKAVELPPALTIVMQLTFGALFGLAGVALATPLTAVLAVLIRMLYVHDVLGDTDGEPKPED
ncbi:MAG: AI-2E family transporter [Gammaproteobacteria bacterium]